MLWPGRAIYQPHPVEEALTVAGGKLRHGATVPLSADVAPPWVKVSAATVEVQGKGLVGLVVWAEDRESDRLMEITPVPMTTGLGGATTDIAVLQNSEELRQVLGCMVEVEGAGSKKVTPEDYSRAEQCLYRQGDRRPC